VKAIATFHSNAIACHRKDQKGVKVSTNKPLDHVC